MRLWQHFIKKYDLSSNLAQEHLYALAEQTPAEQGAFVEEFCRNYRGYIRAKLLREKGYSTLLDALRAGTDISDLQINKAITPELLLEDVRQVLYKKSERNGVKEKSPSFIGFKKQD